MSTSENVSDGVEFLLGFAFGNVDESGRADVEFFNEFFPEVRSNQMRKYEAWFQSYFEPRASHSALPAQVAPERLKDFSSHVPEALDLEAS
jgi:hypothetical protein